MRLFYFNNSQAFVHVRTYRTNKPYATYAMKSLLHNHDNHPHLCSEVELLSSKNVLCFSAWNFGVEKNLGLKANSAYPRDLNDIYRCTFIYGSETKTVFPLLLNKQQHQSHLIFALKWIKIEAFFIHF